MFRPRLIPTLLLQNNALVKSVKFKNHNYIGDPINAVKIFCKLFKNSLNILYFKRLVVILNLPLPTESYGIRGKFSKYMISIQLL